jgi:hypothetical protein
MLRRLIRRDAATTDDKTALRKRKARLLQARGLQCFQTL